MAKLSNIVYEINAKIPFDLKEDWDNVGLLVGDENNNISKILFALDITDEIIEEAKREGCELIISHHPLFFKSEVSEVLNDNSAMGKVYRLIRANIAAICLHTNLDSVKGGVNDILADACGLKDIKVMQPGINENAGLGRYGFLERDMPLKDFADRVKENLKAPFIIVHDGGQIVKKVCVLGGSMPEMMIEAKKSGCDTFVTGEMKHHHYLLANELKINVLAAGHHFTEYLGLDLPIKVITSAFPDIKIYKSNLLDNILTVV